jgi:glycosyltransferase involved in cell wall biosynthesis
MPDKIKVLECIRQGQIGGGESHLLSLVENLDKKVFEPVVLSFTDGPMIDRLQQMHVPVHVIPTTRPFDVSKWKEVKRFVAEKKVQLIHAHGTRAASNLFYAARSLRLPMIYTVHGWSFHPDQRPLVRRIRIMGERFLTRRSALNISVSSSNQQTGKDYLGNFESVVVNNGIDLEKFHPGNNFSDVRRELGIPGGALLVLFLARFTSHKQPLSLIRAFSEALPSVPEMHLLMVGDGDQKEEAVSLIRELNLEGRVTLSPFRQDVPDVLAAADIYVLPSLWEGLPIGLLEAMAMGRAIIATAVDGTSEIIRDDENGTLISTDGLVHNLAESLKDLAHDAEKRKRFGTQAIATVTERFNAAVMTREIERIYRDLIN